MRVAVDGDRSVHPLVSDLPSFGFVVAQDFLQRRKVLDHLGLEDGAGANQKEEVEQAGDVAKERLKN